jgi:hypothetical protein
VIKIKDIIKPADKEKFNDVYIVYELMDTDLHQIIQSNQALTDEHCQVICFCVFLLHVESLCVWISSLLKHLFSKSLSLSTCLYAKGLFG